ncbi:MAG: hypothetical protein MI743_14760 [Sneathiellales bacterium]|nr:hypothetical protein [Sneathiellales bacterium]
MISKTFTVLTAFAAAICLSVLCSHTYVKSNVTSLNASELVQIAKPL